jgi:hypothetical protein
MKQAQLYTLLALACSLIVSTAAQAETQPAQPAKTTIPESTFRFIDPNPAATANFGWGRFRLPSVHIDIGSSVPIDSSIQDFTSLGKSLTTLVSSFSSGQTASNDIATSTKTQLSKTLAPFQSGARLDYETEIALVSFAGSPFPALQIANRPLSLGLNIGAETRGYANVQFSKEFSDSLSTLADSLPELISSGTTVAGLTSNASQLTSQTAQLTSNLTQLVTAGNQLLQNPSTQQLGTVTTLASQVSGNVDQLLVPAKSLTKAVTDSAATTQGLLNTIKGASSGGISLDSANDLHVTVALSGAYPVYETQDIKVSVGTNLKLFLMPFNVPFRSLGLNSDSSVMGQIKVTDFVGLKNLDGVQSTLDSLTQAAGDVDKLIAQAESVKKELDTANQNLGNNNIAAIAGQVQPLINSVTTANQALQTSQQSINTALQNVNGIQQTLSNELQQVSLKGSITTPSGAGFGLDLGVNAILFRNLHLNLTLQNPVVVWQGTERPFEARVASSTGQLQPSLAFQDDQAKSVNYNATVPFAVLFNGRYNLDEVLPNFQGLYLNGRFEYVNNGRNPGLTLGLQKQFGNAYAGLGGRLGGISSMIYGEAGLRLASNFGLDLQLGVSPAGTGIPAPGMSWLNSALLGMYLQF